MHASASATIHKLPLLTVTEMELNFEQLAISGKPSGYNFPKDRPTEACGVPIIVELSTRIRSTQAQIFHAAGREPQGWNFRFSYCHCHW
jgi:hypothetical protein